MTGLKRRVKSTARWLAVLQAGLDGHPQSLGAGEADAMEKCLAKLDIHLLSQTKAARQNMRLRRGAKPVVIRYYGAPISRRHPLFCAEQFRPEMRDGKMLATGEGV